MKLFATYSSPHLRRLHNPPDMSKRQNVTITVFDGEQHGGDWPTPGYPAHLVDAINWFQSKLEEIPVEYRETALCEIDSAGGYEGSHYGHIEISYVRPETDEEMASRIVRNEQREAAKRVEEIAALRALRARYPDA